MSISTAFCRLLRRTQTLSTTPARPIFASQITRITRSYSRHNRPSKGLRPGDLIQTESKRRREWEPSKISISYHRNCGGPSRLLAPGDIVDFAGPTESKRSKTRLKREAKIKAGVDLDSQEEEENRYEDPTEHLAEERNSLIEQKRQPLCGKIETPKDVQEKFDRTVVESNLL